MPGIPPLIRGLSVQSFFIFYMDSSSPWESFPPVPSDLSPLPAGSVPSVPSLPSLGSDFEVEQPQAAGPSEIPAPNQVPAAEGQPTPSPSSNPSASRGEEAGPSNRTPPVVPYPYQPDEVIGGDSVESIQRRLLVKDSCPSAEVIRQAEIEAQDLFEVKVAIIQQMTALHPEGDWMGRGARALENARTRTGEENLEKLHTFLSDLETNGVRSETFSQLKKKVPLRRN